jgi:small subunit ribosomal protein S17
MAEDKNTDTETDTPAAPESEANVEETTDAAVEADAVAEQAPAVESDDTPPVEEPAAADEPVAEAAAPADEAAAPAEPEVPAEPQAQSQPKKKFKRLPRAERPKKTRVTRPAPTGERKPISREPKPEHDRGRRQERRGVVVSDAMDKTIVVKVDTIRAHPRYKKVIRRSTKFHAHDEANTAKVGDLVRIIETRPLSKTKNWRLAEIVEAAK